MFINPVSLWRIMDQNKRRKAPIIGLSSVSSGRNKVIHLLSSPFVGEAQTQVMQDKLPSSDFWFNPQEQGYLT